jgi:hypothetical protein
VVLVGDSGGPSTRLDSHTATSKRSVGVLELSSKRLALLRWLRGQFVTLVPQSGDDCCCMRLCHQTRRAEEIQYMSLCIWRNIPEIKTSTCSFVFSAFDMAPQVKVFASPRPGDVSSTVLQLSLKDSQLPIRQVK